MTEEPKPESEWPAWLVVGLIIGLLAFLYAFKPARAHEREHPELNGWFQSLHSKRLYPCCDGSDKNHVDESDWDTKDNHYRVRIDGKWVDVPDDAVVEGPNLEGHAMEWHHYKDGEPVVHCFMPGSGT